MKPTILILTTHTGGGHLNLAQSLKEMLEGHYEVVIADPQPGGVDRFYAAASRHFLKYLDWQFVLTDNEVAALWQHRLLMPVSSGRLLHIIEQVQPQLLVVTHAHLSYLTARVNERLPRRIPLVFQLTDLESLHMMWFTEKHADAYLVPTREIFGQALEQGIDRNHLYLTGRPVRRQFLEVSTYVRDETLAALDLNPAIFTIFLQGGAKGSAGIDRTVEGLLSASAPMQIILAAGNNEKMVACYAGMERVRVLPFTEMVAPYMAASDVIAGKAGASFISEAFMVEKPFLISAFIPGQETPNLQFLERHNLGWVCLETRAQQELLSRMAGNPAMMAEKVASIRAYKAWNMQANLNIRPTIDQLLSGENRINDQEPA